MDILKSSESAHGVLRKMEPREKSFNQRDTYQNISMSYRIQSQINLFEHVSLVRRAFHLWSKMHPFLRAKVAVNSSDNEPYFELNESSQAYLNLENIYFIRFHNSSSGKPQQIEEEAYEELLDLLTHWHLCGEKIIDTDKNVDLLWRAVIVELDISNKSQLEFEILLQFHHSIADGVSLGNSFLHLLSILTKLLITKTSNLDVPQFGVFPGADYLFRDIKKEPFKRLDVPRIETPAFFDPARAAQTSYQPVKHFNDEDIRNLEFVNVETNSSYVSLGQLVDCSKAENIKIKRFSLDPQQSAKLLARCKKENVKVTSFINMVACFAMAKLYAKHNASLSEVLYHNPINLRPFLDKNSPDGIKFEEENLGLCIGGLFSVFKNDASLDDEESLWSKAREANAEFTHRVQNDKEKFSFSFADPNDSNKTSKFHFTFSNILILNTAALAKSPFNIVGCHGTGSMKKNASNLFFLLGLTSVNNRMFLILHYNAHYIDNFLVEEFLSYCEQTLLKICNS